MKEITVPAVLEELDRVLEFVNGELIACGCPVKTQMQLDIAVEELYVNIARYAYHPEIGNATVRCTVGGCLLYTSIGKNAGGIGKQVPSRGDDPGLSGGIMTVKILLVVLD